MREVGELLEHCAFDTEGLILKVKQPKRKLKMHATLESCWNIELRTPSSKTGNNDLNREQSRSQSLRSP